MSLKRLAYIRPPHAGEVYGRLIVSAGEVFQVPREWKGRTVRFYTSGGTARILFGGNSSISITDASVSSHDAGTKKLTPNATTSPDILVAGSFQDYEISGAAGVNDYFVIKGPLTSGTWYAFLADYTSSVQM